MLDNEGRICALHLALGADPPFAAREAFDGILNVCAPNRALAARCIALLLAHPEMLPASGGWFVLDERLENPAHALFCALVAGAEPGALPDVSASEAAVGEALVAAGWVA